MSLINDVLRDLDRRQGGAQSPMEGLRPVPSVPARRPGLALLTVVALLVATGAVAWLVWQQWRGVATGPQALPPAAVARSDAPAGAAIPQAPAVAGAQAAGAHDSARRQAAELAKAAPAQSGVVTAAATAAAVEPPPVSVTQAQKPEAKPAPLAASASATPPIGEQPRPTPAPTPTTIAVVPPPAAAQPAAPQPKFEKAPVELTATQRAERDYAQARRELAAGQEPEALRLLLQALDLDPDHRGARESLLEVLLGRGRVAEAERLLLEALARHPGDLGFALRYARLLVGQGREPAAIDLLEPHAGAVGDGEHLALLAALYQRQARYAESVASYRLALAANGRSAWWLGLGISAEGAGDGAAARDAYQKALDGGGLTQPLRAYAEARLSALYAR